MRGRVLDYQDLEGTGIVSGDDGQRYSFTRGDLQGGVRVVRQGQDVDFQAADGRATLIYVTGAAGAGGAATDSITQALNSFDASLNTGEKSRLVAGVLAIVLGALGVHKFYLGLTNAGIIMLAVCLVGSIIFGIGPLAMAVVGLIEGIIYLTKSDADFQQTYVVGKKAWF